MIEGKIDSTFITLQRDIITSGGIAEIGANAFAVWSVVKFYADYSTGQAFPGMREIGNKIGVSQQTVKRAVDILVGAKMLRIEDKSKFKRKGQTYIARERLAVRLGSEIVCTIAVDYVPLNLRNKISSIKEALTVGENNVEAWKNVEIIPNSGFIWDVKDKTFKATKVHHEIPINTLPSIEFDESHEKFIKDYLLKNAPNLTASFASKILPNN